ncbi:hypothetical protein BD413DRAFT_84670 [Trametes elegans]|nr:hypothetical protein BD413DRAFT_84670 [Trametes elegans]
MGTGSGIPTASKTRSGYLDVLTDRLYCHLYVETTGVLVATDQAVSDRELFSSSFAGCVVRNACGQGDHASSVSQLFHERCSSNFTRPGSSAMNSGPAIGCVTVQLAYHELECFPSTALLSHTSLADRVCSLLHRLEVGNCFAQFSRWEPASSARPQAGLVDMTNALL